MSLTRFYNLRLAKAPDTPTELWVRNGHFVDPPNDGAAAQSADLGGQLVLPGLIETHVHLDKACIADRCRLIEGTLAEAIEQTRIAKAGFDRADILDRGRNVIERAILQGTTHMRTHVEIDPVIGLTGFYAVQQLQHEYAWALTLEICVFPQEGMLNNPGTEALMQQALDQGADLLGGCPYTDSDPAGQVIRLFEIARERDLDLDFHLDFDLDPATSLLPCVIEQTLKHGWQGRVTVGHATKLSAMPAAQFDVMAGQLAAAGIAVTALPSTDLFLNGRQHDHNVPRGVAPLHRLGNAGVCCSLSTNNIGNPFTPFGDMSLIRQANLFANLAQLGTPAALIRCLGWITDESARLLRLTDYGLSPGCRADFICLPAQRVDQVVGEILLPSRGYKAGVQTFSRDVAVLHRPALADSGGLKQLSGL